MHANAAVAAGRLRRWRAAMRVLLVIGLFLSVGAWIALLVQVETVIFSGPVLVLAGVGTLLAGWRGSYRPAAYVGAAHVAISLLFFVLVNLLQWGPGDARLPFAWMGFGYVAVMIPVNWKVISRVPRTSSPWECQYCGYLLYGLNEPRCPECGNPFDANSLRDLEPPPGV